MAMICEIVNQTTQACDKWIEYTPVIPDLTSEQILVVWGWFALSLFASWAFKKLIHLFGVW
ncbi:hypothetical protein R4646_17740 [Acinetobacter baumannii]|uniref:hypothetical protein n=1 Tax=Acinetobacter calcoaceticus/baumannii complex TaxID=909768 RepID=UPI001250C120|nr:MULTISPECIES: hypothetical protein [Acinetobacter calcoaceticus/baumannii complex]MDH2648684.1 hypothetical protein [Acinetobacter baumannii]MDV7648782.1 hypothetical protein [Acinetobacter baumannii]MDV7648791.1 hypothetical protein [Acinetobacter baumannii]MDV7648800.1 hypothetical protein [Acinetobacter baumannii]